MEPNTQVFIASRWTKDNLIFPVRLEVSCDRVTRVKPSLFGRTEVSISIPNVASVSIQAGLLWSDIRIDSSGGSNPIESHGHRNADAKAIRTLIEHYQAKSSR